MIKGQITLESWMIANAKPGKVFYSEKADKDLTAIASYYKREIITERLIAVTNEPVAFKLTKVTLLGFK